MTTGAMLCIAKGSILTGIVKGSILSVTVVLICMFEDNKFDIKMVCQKLRDQLFSLQ